MKLKLRSLIQFVLLLGWVPTVFVVDLMMMVAGAIGHRLGSQPREGYLTDRLGWYYVTMRTVNELGAAGGVLFLWEPRSLYCDVDCQPDSMLDHWWHARRTIGSPDQIADRWRRDGTMFVLLNSLQYRAAIDLGIDRSTAEDQQALNKLIADHLELVRDFGGIYQLYRWRMG